MATSSSSASSASSSPTSTSRPATVAVIQAWNAHPNFTALGGAKPVESAPPAPPAPAPPSAPSSSTEGGGSLAEIDERLEKLQAFLRDAQKK